MGIIGSFEGYVSDPLYLFNNGTWNGLHTTGMSGGTVSGGELLFTGKAIGRLNQTVDLTNYNYIKINSHADISSGVSGRKIGISQNSNLTSISSTNCTAYIDARNTTSGPVYYIASLNVSSISGYYYIYTSGYMYNNNAQVSNPSRLNQLFLSVR